MGGDVDRISLGGHSAGSTCVTQLLVSPHSNTLFSQAIQLSGSGLADWAYSDKVITDSLKLSAQVGCTGTDVKKCLQEKTVEELLDAMSVIGSHRKHMSFFQFHPRFDCDFFPDDMDSLFKKAPKKKTIQGVTSQENYVFIALAKFDFNYLYLNDEKRKRFGVESFDNLLKTTFGEKDFGEQTQAINSWALMSYCDLSASHNSTFYLLRYMDLCGDVMFNVPIQQEVLFKTQNEWETYYYVNDYITDTISDPTGLRRGGTHGDEIRYLLEMNNSVPPIPLSDNDKRFQNVYISSLVNFIKTGFPSTESVQWFPTTTENPGRHLRMNTNPQMTEDAFRGAAAKLWLERFPRFFDADTVRKTIPGFPRVQEEL